MFYLIKKIYIYIYIFNEWAFQKLRKPCSEVSVNLSSIHFSLYNPILTDKMNDESKAGFKQVLVWVSPSTPSQNHPSTFLQQPSSWSSRSWCPCTPSPCEACRDRSPLISSSKNHWNTHFWTLPMLKLCFWTCTFKWSCFLDISHGSTLFV